jgi:pyruvoyl-dependent arginine decarboxylase (PvlArgDC)
MKKSFKTVLMLSFLLLSILGNSQDKQIFESPKIQEFISTHKKVAILPFNATIGYRKLPKDYNAEANKEEEMKLGYDMQSGMYTFLLRKISDYSVEVQDIERTNILLKKNNLIDKLAETAPEELAKVLEVDAVIKCSYAYQKTKSEGGAIALTLLVGFGTGSVATGTLTMQINDGKEGELVWRFYKQMAEDVMSSPASMMERMMRKVGRNFPYQK